MKARASVRLLLVGTLLGALACTQRTAVGDNKTYCPGGDQDCPFTQPHCDVELVVCAQCLQHDDCGGSDPLCDAGVCVCTGDADCPGDLSCRKERCE